MFAMWCRVLRHWFLQLRPAQRQSKATGTGHFTISTEVRTAIEGDHVGFLHIGRGRVFRSNLTGSRVWRELASGQDLSAIAAELSADYGVPQEQVEKDIEAFVTDLENQGLLTAAR